MGGAAARVHGLSRWLVSFGHKVTVITGFPNYPTGFIPRGYRGRFRMKERKDDVDIIRTWVYATSHRSGIGRLSNYSSFMLSSVITGLSIRGEYDVVLASSPPLLIGIVGRVLSRIRGIPFVFDVRDIWPDVAVDAGAFHSGDILVRLGRYLARRLYARADHITPVTEAKYDKIVAEGAGDEKVTVVPNGVDFDRLGNENVEKWRRVLKPAGPFVAAYTGLIGIAQGVETIVDAANFLHHDRGIHFLIVGDGVERKRLMQKAKYLNLNNVTFVPSQPREEVASILALADVVLVPLVSKNLLDAVPSKLMEAWACQKPVVLVASGEAARLVDAAGGGVVVPPQDPKRLADTVVSLSKDSDALFRYAENGYEFVKTHFDRKDLARSMEDVLMTVCRRKE